MKIVYHIIKISWCGVFVTSVRLRIKEALNHEKEGSHKKADRRRQIYSVKKELKLLNLLDKNATDCTYWTKFIKTGTANPDCRTDIVLV